MDAWHYDPAPTWKSRCWSGCGGSRASRTCSTTGVRSAAAVGLQVWLRLYHRSRDRRRGKSPAPSGRACWWPTTPAISTRCACCRRCRCGDCTRPFPRRRRTISSSACREIAVSVLVVNALPFHRETHVRQSLAVCRELLAEPGNILIIFPEGTRSARPARWGTFKPGHWHAGGRIGRAGRSLLLVRCPRRAAQGMLAPPPRANPADDRQAADLRDQRSEKESLRQMCQDLQGRWWSWEAARRRTRPTTLPRRGTAQVACRP